MKEDSARDRKS